MSNIEAIQSIFMREGTSSEDTYVTIYTMQNRRLIWEGKIKDLDQSQLNIWSIVSITRYGSDTIPKYNQNIAIEVV